MISAPGYRAPLALAAAALLLGALQVVMGGPLPGEEAFTRVSQSMFGAERGWAAWLTDTAKAPLLWATLGLGMALAWLGLGRRAVLVPPLALALAHVVDLAPRGAARGPAG